MVLEDMLKKLSKDVKFVKYQFTDLQGNIREVTNSVGAIKGQGTTAVDGSSVFGKIIPPTESDMMLIPDLETLRELPWSPQSARVICDVYNFPEKEGMAPKPFDGCPRGVLRKVEKSMSKVLNGKVLDRYGQKADRLHAHMAPELEFLLLPKEYDHLQIHNDANILNDSYFIPPAENVNKILGQVLEILPNMGIKKEKFHTEVTTYQVELGMGHGNALAMADATMTVKYVIKALAQLNGMKASFIPKFRKGVNGSGMHVHQNLAATLDGKERNIFYDDTKKWALSEIGSQYIAGLLKYAREITALTNPQTISYKRLVPGCEAPTYIAWDWKNRTALCRGHSENKHPIRVEYRAPDGTSNPYLAFAAMLAAGLEGISSDLKLNPPEKRDFYHDNDGVRELPGSLGEALIEMNGSKMLRKRLGGFIVDTVFKLGMTAYKDDSTDVTDRDIAKYF